MSSRTTQIVAVIVVLFAQACLSGDHDSSAAIEGCDQFPMTPVLFVHGSGLSAASWSTMIRFLDSSGYPAPYLLAAELKPNDGDNIRAAEELINDAANDLITKAKAVFHDSGCTGNAPDRIAIVAHSMGSISSRWYASRIAPERVSALIALAGSNHGSNALCELPGQGNMQMCPAYSDDTKNDRMQTELNGTSFRPTDETPYGVGRDADPSLTVAPDAKRSILYVTVRLEPDKWILPAASALLDGAGTAEDLPLPFGLNLIESTSGNYRFLGQSSHDELPEHPQICQFVLHVLTNWID